MACGALFKCFVSLAVLSYLWQAVKSDYYPVYGRGSSVFYNASIGSRRYPDTNCVTRQSYEYFLSNLQFDVVDGKLICGAADKLYVLDSADLTEVSSLNWTSVDTSECDSDDPDYICRNHIRVHTPLPSDNSKLFVCGTQATETPRCRIVKVEDDGSLDASPDVPVTNGIVSYYPGFSQFGEFRNETTSDTTYFTAGFFEGSSGLGRHFSISYQRVTTTVEAQETSLSTSETLRTIKDNNNWLRFPVTFVDYLRLDYPGDNEYDYQFYFAFIRENLYTTTGQEDIIQSRVVRICRNDPGSGTASPYFTTYMKARIYCERQLEAGDEYNGAIKYLYNELRSIAFTERGRYSTGGNYGKKLYGAFSGPVVGPHGTAICVYSAENTAEAGGNNAGRSQSMFDIFREDLLSPSGSNVEHSFYECDPGGRDIDEAQNVLVKDKSVSQLGSDPLIVLDGLLVNQMVLDQQCVVKGDNARQCSSQDILFLGTDAGKVLKVVFATNDSVTFPVIVEEISLDDDNNIEKMAIRDRYLFVNTHSKIYKFPLARCSRHESCIDCVGSRDPYCMWNGTICVPNPFPAEESDVDVDVQYVQNIHEGFREECRGAVHCDLITSATSYEIIQLKVSCDNADNEVSVNIPKVPDFSTVIVSLDENGIGSANLQNPPGGFNGLESYTVAVTARGTVFTSVVTMPPGPPLPITEDEILIDSITSNSFKITLNINQYTDYFSQYYFKIEGYEHMQYFFDGTSHTVTDLEPARDSPFTVEVYNSKGMVNRTIDVRTLDDVPGIVSGVSAAPSERSVSLMWSEPSVTNGEIIGYVVRVRSGDEGEWVDVIGCGGWGNSPMTSYEVRGLVPATSYQFRVSACTSAGEGPSYTVHSTTLCSLPGPVTDLALTATNSSSLAYSWSAPIDIVNGSYQVDTTCYSEIQSTKSLTKASPLMGTINNLSPLTLCCVRVTAISNCISHLAGPPSEVCRETSDVVPEAVSSLTVEGANRNGIIAYWDPPPNYQRSGLNYSISITPDIMFITQQSYFYLDSLEALTEYTVTVVPVSGEGEGPQRDAVNTTLLPPPPPPSNPRLLYDGNVLTLSWSLNSVDTYGVIGYTAELRCNEEDPVINIIEGGMNTSTTFNRNIGGNFVWCAAKIQAENGVGKGEFSELASTAIPNTAPSKPRCFLVDDRGSQISISFDVTHPFSLESLFITYNITSESNSTSSNLTFNSLAANVISIPVSRNTKYDFQLQVCNTHGCSDSCDELREFTTSPTPPQPPSAIEVETISHDSVHLSWTAPESENVDNIQYFLQLSGDRTERISVAGMETTRRIENLTPDVTYTVALQSIDMENMIDGLFGEVVNFTTNNGTPSAPRAVELVGWEPESELLSVSWAIPMTTNGTISQYEVVYGDLDSTKDCEKPDGRNYTMASERNLETRSISQIKSLIVCVRAYTDLNNPGPWETVMYGPVSPTTGRLQPSSSESNCNGLIAVAIVAALAVVSTVVASIVLFLVFRRRIQVSDGKSSHSSNDRPPQNGTPDPFQRLDSTGSTGTLKPLLPSNGSIYNP